MKTDAGTITAAGHRIQADYIRAQVTQATHSTVRDALKRLDAGDLAAAADELQQAAGRVDAAAARIAWHDEQARTPFDQHADSALRIVQQRKGES